MSSIKLKHSSGNSMSIGAPATNPASDLELKLPATVGAAGQILKNSSTAGTLEFGGVPSMLATSSSYEGLELQTPSGDGSGEFHIGVHQSGSSAGRSIVFKRGGSDGMDTESMRINSSGRIGVGTTSPGSQLHTYASSSDGLQMQTANYQSYVWQIESSGNLFNGSQAGELGLRGQSGIGFCANNGSTAHFRIESDGDLVGTDTSIGSISDSRVKKNVADYTYDLAKFKQLTPKTFDWINPEEHLKDTNVRGFLAQDVKTIDDYWIKETNSVNKLDKELIGEGKALSSKLGASDAMYVSVIKQLIAKIETLESKVAALEAA